MTLNPYASCHPNGQVGKLNNQYKTFFANIGMCLLLLLLIILLPNQTNAQQPTDLSTDGRTHTVGYNGTYQDFIIPNDPSIQQITFTAKGGDGGVASTDNGYAIWGGSGATLTATFKVGSGAIPYGSTIRFIVGGAGESGTWETTVGIGAGGVGGGGGTGILYRVPGDPTWHILAVAGGGGGGFVARYFNITAFAVETYNGDGKGGNTSTGGTNGGAPIPQIPYNEGSPAGGGSNGDGGGGTILGGGGGGKDNAGGGSLCNMSSGGGGKGLEEGGPGGNSVLSICNGSYLAKGGFGFGGGGVGSKAGGGGGGYSGGGAGYFSGGGGGGSFVADLSISKSITGGVITGNPTNGYVNYTVIRNEPPIARCIGSLDVLLDKNGTATITGSQISSGSSDPEGGSLSFSVSPSTFNCSNIGANTVTLTVTDNTGQTSTCTATVNVKDNTAPIAKCKSASVFLDANGNASITAAQVNNGSTDNCGITSMNVFPSTFNCTNLGDNIVTLTLTDHSGNSSTCTALVTVKDNIAPVANCRNISAFLDVNGNASITAAQVNNGSTDNCGIASITVSPSTFNCTNLGDNIVTLTVTDHSGNSSTCTATVNVIDNIAPIARCKDLFVLLDSRGNAIVTAARVNDGSTDNCAIASMTVSPSIFNCSNLGDNVITLTVTDNSGNSSTCTATATVIDNIAPTIVCPDDITVANDPGACGAILDFTNQIIAKDNCSYTLTYSKNPGSFFDIGTTPVTITITDLSGNSKSCTFNIIVEDREAPKTLPLAPIQISCDASTDPNNTGIASFSDNCGIINIGFSDRIVPGTCADDYAILRTWSASDAAGNTTSFVQEITILPDRILPICTNCPGDITVSCESIPDFPNLIVTDNCDPNPAIDISQTSTQKLDGSCQEFAYEITRTFTITDRCGNASVYKQIITVIDETAPIITCPGDVTVDCRDIYNLEITGMAIATDNCDANPTIEYQDEVAAGDCEWECTVKRTWMATDACGNSSSCVQTIIRTAVGLVKTALGEGPIELGIDRPYPSDNSDNFLYISAEAAQCIVDWLPGAGGAPHVIPNGHYIVDGSDCTSYEGLLDENGKITNSMLSEMLILAINLRLNPDMVDIPLKELECTFHPIIYQHMRGTPTIGKMYTVGINYLGNVYGPNHQPFFRDAIRCINGTFKDKCAPTDTNSQSVTSSATNRAVLPVVSTPRVNKILNIYPNPTSGVFYLDLSEFAAQSALVRIYNIQGKIISEQNWKEAPTGPISFNLQEQPAGIYLVKMLIGGDRVITSKVIVGN